METKSYSQRRKDFLLLCLNRGMEPEPCLFSAQALVPARGQRFRPSAWLSPSDPAVPFVLLGSSSLCIFPVISLLDFETIYDRRQEKLAQ